MQIKYRYKSEQILMMSKQNIVQFFVSNYKVVLYIYIFICIKWLFYYSRSKNYG